MVIVETVEQFDTMLKSIKSDVVLIPIFEDDKAHAAINPICALCVSTKSESYIVTFTHNDALKLPTNLINKIDVHIWTPDKKKLMAAMNIPSNRINDVNSIEYLNFGKVTDESAFYTKTHTTFYSMYDNQRNINKSISLMKHIEFIENYLIHLNNIITLYKDESAYNFFNKIEIPTLAEIEKNGLCVVPSIIEANFGKKSTRFISNNTIYSEYNVHTTTGRPSNKHGGINFAALNKKNESRKSFVSRFDNGALILADFESFHLRIIANLIDYKIPTDISIHEYFGKQYFSTNSLTAEQYEMSKQITFNLLYSDDVGDDVPDFFKEVKKYVKMLMVLFNEQGYITSPFFKKKILKSEIEDPSAAKIFNYMIQMAETELNMLAISKILPLFENKNSKIILYTYDSILIDYDGLDGKNLLSDVIKVLSSDNQYPMRVYYGKNYHDMSKLMY